MHPNAQKVLQGFQTFAGGDTGEAWAVGLTEADGERPDAGPFRR